MRKIYIIGGAVGSCRTQNLIKYLLDHNYIVYYNPVSLSFYKDKKGLKMLIRKTIKTLEKLLLFPYRVYYIAMSEIVILPAMQNNYQSWLKIASFFGKRIICDYYISFFDTEVLDREKYSINSRQAKRLMAYDYSCINRSNYVFFLNTTEAHRYLNLVNITYDNKKHLIVPLVIEESIKCKLPYYNSDHSTFNICWWGTYIPLHGLENILKACQLLLLSKKIKFHLYLFGNDEEKSVFYRRLIKDLGISEVVTMENSYTFKNGKLGVFLENNCDLVLGNFGNSEKAKNVLVNKLVDGVAMKAPVLTGESIAPLEFFSKNDIFYSYNSPEEIVKAIVSISKESTVDIQARVNNAYKVYRRFFSPTAFYRNLDNLFEKLIQ